MDIVLSCQICHNWLRRNRKDGRRHSRHKTTVLKGNCQSLNLSAGVWMGRFRTWSWTCGLGLDHNGPQVPSQESGLWVTGSELRYICLSSLWFSWERKLIHLSPLESLPRHHHLNETAWPPYLILQISALFCPSYSILFFNFPLHFLSFNILYNLNLLFFCLSPPREYKLCEKRFFFFCTFQAVLFFSSYLLLHNKPDRKLLP